MWGGKVAQHATRFGDRVACYTHMPRSRRMVVGLLLVAACYLWLFSGFKPLLRTDGRPGGIWVASRENAVEVAIHNREKEADRLPPTGSPPSLSIQPDYRLPPMYWPENYRYPTTDRNLRANACLVLLAREDNLNFLLDVLKSFEDRFNSRYKYPYIIFNDKVFSDKFKNTVEKVVSSPVTWARVTPDLWEPPSYIDMTLAKQKMKEMAANNIIYGDSLNYRKMCRFFSGMLYKHPEIQKYDYYWRLDSSAVRFHCDIDFDPFVYMQQHDKLYGFTISLHEYQGTIPTLWQTTMKYLKEHKDKVPASWMNFFTDNGETFNGHHFWSNFEIASVKFFSSKEYQDYFDYLDKAGGFYYERWGDAPVHSLALGLFARKDQVHWFNEIGYYHAPWTHCPIQPELLKKCDCQAKLLVDDIPFSSLHDFFVRQPKTIAENKAQAEWAVGQMMSKLDVPKNPLCETYFKANDAGDWMICTKPKLEPVCKMYSFSVRGASTELSFELQALKKGCAVYYFNQFRKPTDLESIVYSFDHNESVFGLRWYQYTLSDVDADGGRRDVSSHLNFVERRLKTVSEMLGHKDELIDIVKFDVEGWELHVLMDIIESGILFNIKHLMFEVHLRAEKFWKYPESFPNMLQLLVDNNFELVHKSVNSYSSMEKLAGKEIPCCFKLYYRNKAYI